MIRRAEQNDIDAIAGIYRHIHEKEKQNLLTTGWIADVYPVRETAQVALERGDLFVYEEEGSVLGAAIINHVQVDVYAEGNWRRKADDREVMVLHTLVVEPSAGHRGIGRKFVDFYESFARENGCPELRMDTNEINVVARSFYKKLGFAEVGTVPCVFNGIPNVNLVLLEKTLD